jgi:hypothetical protein
MTAASYDDGSVLRADIIEGGSSLGARGVFAGGGGTRELIVT